MFPTTTLVSAITTERHRGAIIGASCALLVALGAVAAAPGDASASSGVYVAAFGASAVGQLDLGAQLAPLAPPSVASGDSPQALAVSPDGRSVYVADLADDTVAQFDVGPDGKLSPKTPATVAAGDGPAAIAISRDGKSVYVADYYADRVSQFDVGAGGVLSPKAPAAIATGQKPAGVAVSPDGRSVYISNYGAASVSQFEVGAGGRLSPRTPSAIGGVPTPAGLTVSPDGASVYVTNFGAGDNRVSQFDILAGGVLRAKTPATVTTGTSPITIAMSPDGKNAYVTNSGDDTVSQFDVGAHGALEAKTPAAVAAGAYPYGVAVAPGGTRVLVTNADGNSVSSYAVAHGGALTPTATVAVATSPMGIAISPERPAAPSATIVAPADGTSYALHAAVHASFACSAGANGGVLKSCSGAVANDSPIDTATAGAHTFTVTATDTDGQTATATSRYTVTPAPSPPRNTALPSIVQASECPQVGACQVIPHTYECRPGTWSGTDPARPYRYTWQRLTPDKRFLSGYRAETVATTASYRATAETNLELTTLSWRFQCVVEAANAGGSASAVSPAKDLAPVLDRLGGTTTYGNLRIRGIDVFQVVQPTAQARAFGYDPNIGAGDPSQAFGFDLAGGGTPTSYRRTSSVARCPRARPQRTPYAGVPLDATKPATAVVYVDVTDSSPATAAISRSRSRSQRGRTACRSPAR